MSEPPGDRQIPPVIFSPDGKPPPSGRMPDPEDVTKIVIGQLPENDEAAGTPALTVDEIGFDIDLEGDLAKQFPKLTHLHLWRIGGLKQLGKLPPGLKCLDVRYCPDLETVGDLPEEALETLVLCHCGRLRQLPEFETGSHWDRITELSFEASAEIEESWIHKFLGRLPALRKLDLQGCEQLTRIRANTDEDWPEALVEIRLDSCRRLRFLPKSWPTKLRRIDLRRAETLTGLPAFPEDTDYIDLAYTRSLRQLPELPAEPSRPRTLFLYKSGAPLSRELYGDDDRSNVAAEVRADRAEIRKFGREPDNELKVILLGNGRCGKSSLARRWVESDFNPNETSTHGIRLWTKKIPFTPEDSLDGQPEEVVLRIWDFAGQDLYHNIHRLFLQSGALFVVCYTCQGDGSDRKTDKKEAALADEEDIRRNLPYWHQQVKSLGDVPGLKIPPPMLVLQTKADRTDAPVRQEDANWVDEENHLRVSAKDDHGFAALEDWISRKAAVLLGKEESRTLPSRAMGVKQELEVTYIEKNREAYREAERKGEPIVIPPHPTLERKVFDEIVRRHCSEGDYHTHPELLLDRLHRSGFLFFNEAHLPGTLILDQRWAIQGIYTVANRESRWNIRENLFRSSGQFTLDLLDRLSWGPAGYDGGQQQLILEFMLSCGMCFELLKDTEALGRKPVYAAPGFFPRRDERAVTIPELADGPGETWSDVRLAKVSEPEIQTILSRIGGDWSRSAEMWQWGARFQAAESRARVLLDWQRESEHDFHGVLSLWFTGPEDREFERFLRNIVDGILADPDYLENQLLDELWPTPEVDPGDRQRHLPEMPQLEEGGLEQLPETRRITPDEGVERTGVRVTFSFANSDDKHPGIGEIPFRAAALLREYFKGDETSRISICDLPEGDERLKEFQDQLATGDLVLVFWSPKYWDSEWCMYEMMRIYQHPPEGRLLEMRVLIHQYPESRLAEEGALRHDEWEKGWIRRATKREEKATEEAKKEEGLRYEQVKNRILRRSAVHGWYEFILREPEKLDEFTTSLLRYRLRRRLELPESEFIIETEARQVFEQAKELLSDSRTLMKRALEYLDRGDRESAQVLSLHALAKDSSGSDAERLALELERVDETRITETLRAVAREFLGDEHD